MSTLAAAFRLIRPLNLVMTLLGVLLGAALAYGTIPGESWPAVGMAACSAMLIAAAGNALNDVFDQEIDAINRADRPLPSGIISPAAARTLWIVLTLSGLTAAAVVSWTHLTLAVLAAVLLYLYSARLKRMPLVGNLTVAFVVGLAMVYGGLVAGPPGGAVIGAVFAFLTTFAREVAKDVEDVEGDQLAGLRTLPIAYGARRARTVFTAALLLTILITPVPFLAMDYGPLFLLLVLVADLVLLRCIWLAPDAPREAATASVWLKGGMLVGIAALFAA